MCRRAFSILLFAGMCIDVAAWTLPSSGVHVILRLGRNEQHDTIGYNLPGVVTRFMRAQSGSIAVQGTNLALFTNYHGKDPDVNVFTSGNLVADYGQIPRPREYSVRLQLSY